MKPIANSIDKSQEPFYRLVSPGVTPDDGRLFIEIDYREGRLSITGVEGPLANGDCRGSCGQCGIRAGLTPNVEEGWDDGKVDKLRRIWDRWHLNDMRAGCAHQRSNWKTDEPLTLTVLTWGPTFHMARRAAESGEASAGEYARYQEIAPRVRALTTNMDTPKHPDLWGDYGRELLALGYVRVEKEEQKTAGRVKPAEHPKGLLCKPCEVCGYEYGSKWLKEPVPASVLGFLRRLQDTRCTYNWGKRRTA